MDSIPQKRCSHCKQYFHPDCFSDSKSSKDGKYVYCRKCTAERRGRIWHPICLIPNGYRQCSRCAELHPMTEEYFRLCPREKGGLTYACRSCLNKVDAQYLDAHREENKQRSKERYYEKTDEYKAYKKKNAEKIAQQKRDWRKNNPDKVKKHKHDSDKRHPESRQRRLSKYIIRHPETTRLRGRVAAMKRRVKTDMTKRSDLLQMYEDQNGRCAYCGISIYWSIKGDIHVDHIKAVVRGGSNDLGNLCLTCADCNYSKSDLDLSEWLLIRGW